MCVARFGQQVHSLVLSEHTDSEESGDKDSQSSKVNRSSRIKFLRLSWNIFLESFRKKTPFHQQINSSSSFRYSLTEDGLVLAERLDSVEHVKEASTEVARAKNEGEDGDDGDDGDDGPGVVDLTGSDDENQAQSSDEADRLTNKGESSQGISGKPNTDCLLPGTYEIILCVDVIETTG